MENNRGEILRQIKELETSTVIPDAVWREICDDIGYAAGYSIRSACRILKIIYLRTQNGESIELPLKGIVLNKSNFEKIIIEYFEPFIFQCILEYEL